MARAKRSTAGGGAKKRAKPATSSSNGATAPAKPAASKGAAKKTSGAASKRRTSAAKKRSAPKTSRRRSAGPSASADPGLFAPLTEGERADALRVLSEDKRVAEMAKVGRYRVISVEPITAKPPSELSEHRLARTLVYDYSSDRSVDACVDLDDSNVVQLRFSKAQPMLARDEEAAAIAIALADERVKAELSLGDEPQVAMHYWSDQDTDLAFTRRSAAVLFGRSGARPSVVAVVDLLDAEVTQVVPASQW